MASDPSIYAQVGKVATPIANPQDQLAKSLQVGNALYAGRQRQMQVAGQQALAQAYQGVQIDPRTGLPDSQQLIANLQQTPGGGLVLPQVIQGLQQQQKLQLEINKSQLDQTQARTNVVNSAYNALVRKGNSVTPSDIFTTVNGLKASGFPVDEAVNDMAVSMPVRQPGMTDQQYGGMLQDYLLNHASRSWGADTQATQFKPNIATVDSGGQIFTRDTNAYTAPGITNAAPITRTLSPAELISQQKGPPNAKGQPTVITGADYANQNGLGYLVPNSSANSGSGQPSAFGANGGRLPSALMNPNRSGGAAPAPGSIGQGSPGYAPAQPIPAGQNGYVPVSAAGVGNASPAPAAPSQGGYGQPAAVQQQGGGTPMVVGLSAAQTAAATAQGTQGQDAAGALFASAQDSPQRQGQISAMLGDLTNYGSGPNSSAWGAVRGRLVQLGVDPGGWAEGQAAQENFAKMSNQFLAKQASALGPVTNDKLALAAESGPNPMFTTLGNQGVLHIAQGNEDAITAKANSWAQAQLPPQQGGQGLSGADYQNWSTQFNQGFSPSAFWYARMAPSERQTLLAGMSSADQSQLFGAIVNGVNQKWIDPSLFAAPAAGTTPPATPAADPTATPPALPLNLTGTGAPAARGY